MKVVCILIDALGWAYLKDRSFLPETLTYRTEVRTVLGFSSGAIPTILSGQLPRESGRWNLFYYDPVNSPFRWLRLFSFLPGFVLNSRVVRRAIRIVSKAVNGFKGYFQIYGVPVELLPYFDISEKKDIYRPGGVPDSIFNRLDLMGLSYRTYSYHDYSDEKVIQTAIQDARDAKVDFQFLYLCELDAFLHHWCHEEDKVEKELRRYEVWLRDLYSEATKDGEEVAFFVFSDHGMTPKRAGFDLLSRIHSTGLSERKDYLPLYDSTMARFWLFSEESRRTIANTLESISCGHILSAAELEALGLDFPDNRYGDIIFLMDPGVMIEPSFMGDKAPDGMHGFHPDDIYSSAAFLGNRHPGRSVRMLTDIYDVMLDWAEATQGAVYVKG